ncbi:MAG TPA: isoprenylcysteine carboxylmethyltransferase family protein [Candidatus Acidoferrum sp.]|jgi:methyltransferase|nr:isoprenylcysteine carboxylmethyltransferase family protein [Candidatus Acidoferrum sp.]
MTPLWWIVVTVALLRVAELVYADRNTRRLRALGAVEIAPQQYPWFIGLHAAWLASLLVFIPATSPPNLFLLAIFALAQVARAWVIVTLGGFWTTRVITLPGAPLVRRGPYRFVRHPNYAIVCVELAVLPLAFGAWIIALIFTCANAALLAWRIAAEDAALDARR